MSYDLSCFNVTGGAVQCINTNSGGSFGVSIIFIVAIIIFYGTRLYRFAIAFLTASFILAVIAGIMFALEWVPGWVAVLCLINLIAAIFIKQLGDG